MQLLTLGMRALLAAMPYALPLAIAGIVGLMLLGSK
jgi:hypothetical protein